MKLTVSYKGSTVLELKEGNNPFCDILEFQYSGETGFFGVGYADESSNGKKVTAQIDKFDRIEITK